jgi:hypothetical protein
MFIPKSRGYTVIPPHTIFSHPLLKPLSLILAKGVFLFDSVIDIYIMNHMKTLKEVLDQMGYITAPQAEALAQWNPHLPVVIQWGGLPREQIAVSLVADRIKDVEDRDIDYCRSVFLTAQQTKQYRKQLE